MGVETSLAKTVLKIGCALYVPNTAVQELLFEVIDQSAEVYQGKVTSIEQQVRKTIEKEISIDALKQKGIPEDKAAFVQSETRRLLESIPVTPKKIACCRGDVNLLAEEMVLSYEDESGDDSNEYSQYIVSIFKSLLPKVVGCLRKDTEFLFQGLMELHGITEELKRQIEEIKEQIAQPNTHQYPLLISDRPFDQADIFVGRGQIVQDAVDRLTVGIPVALCGIGGIGKTEIAKAVVKRVENEASGMHQIEAIAWVEYDNQDVRYSIVKSFRETRQIDDFERAWEKADSIIQKLRDRLLLVIDKVESVSQDSNLLRLADMPCRILITSREEKVSSIESIMVDSLPDEGCGELFHYYYRKDPAPSYLVDKIIRLADRHTVTIELLAKIAQIEDLTLSEFYENLVAMGFDLSEEKVNARHERLQKEERIIEQLAILFSVQRLKETETQLLIPVSVIPSIPFQFSQAEEWFDQKDRTNLNRLVRSGWLYAFRRDKTTQYMIHSVIASAVRHQFASELYGRCRKLIRALTQQMRYGEDEHGSAKVELIQFSWSVNDLLSDHLKDEADGDFLFNLSRIYGDVGNYRQAVLLLRRCIHLYRQQKKRGKQSGCYNLLGLVYQNQGWPARALTQYNKALQWMDALEMKEEMYISLYSNKGIAYLALEGNVPNGRAHQCFKKAYILAKQNYGDDDPRTLDVQFKEANCIAPQNSDEAIKIFMDVIEAEKRIFGLHDLRLGRKYQAFGNYLYDIGEFRWAASESENALAIFKATMGEGHPDTADVKNTLALIYRQFDSEKSIQYFSEYLDNAKEIYGDSSPVTATAYNNLGCWYFDEDRFKEALAEFERAEKTLRAVQGYNPEDMGRFLCNQAQCQSSMGNNERAIKLLKRALLEYRKDPKLCAGEIGQCYGVMGDVYCNLDNKPKAHDYFDLALEQLRGLWGGEHLSMASIYNNYALLLEVEELYDDALSKLDSARQILLRSYNESTPQLVYVEENIERIRRAKE